MSIAADIATILTAESTVKDAVSDKVVKAYAMAAPQRDPSTREIVKPPFVIVGVLNTEFHNTLQADGVAAGTRMVTLDIDCKGRTEAEAGLVYDAVGAYLDDFSGTAGNSTVDSVGLDDGGDDVETPEHGGRATCVREDLGSRSDLLLNGSRDNGKGRR